MGKLNSAGVLEEEKRKSRCIPPLAFSSVSEDSSVHRSNSSEYFKINGFALLRFGEASCKTPPFQLSSHSFLIPFHRKYEMELDTVCNLFQFLLSSKWFFQSLVSSFDKNFPYARHFPSLPQFLLYIIKGGRPAICIPLRTIVLGTDLCL